jgi:hypothetical protein
VEPNEKVQSKEQGRVQHGSNHIQLKYSLLCNNDESTMSTPICELPVEFSKENVFQHSSESSYQAMMPKGLLEIFLVFCFIPSFFD